ncbi:Hsp20/alpha crystallin family protein [Sedimentisphaera salicampi]|uniref:SHSP domain-containing protein n=1 Tax=Sedimentisphaera salicampi TaxID=1941349 RepID=A0A1W6LQB4_9BACT|nr:Hsp20/alpha crystallin family protein [Sedimentisphaera salicampi]ARN57957.1 hypothetical protein STSP1_02383 [Sedimentisphaera salicampi]OXU14125.1 hypothetical protein SMSP1_02287 [Sedimentisphaera salicampi]
MRNVLSKRNNNQTPNAPMSMADKIDRMFDDMFSGFPAFGAGEGFMSRFVPSVDVSEDEKKYEITAELAGMDKDDINVTMNDNTLILEGEKKNTNEEKDSNYYHVERTFGSFRRAVPFAHNVDEENIDASFKDGLLKITVPKTEEGAGRKKIEIN